MNEAKCLLIIIDNREISYSYAKKILKNLKKRNDSIPYVLLQNKIDLIDEEVDKWIKKMKQQLKRKNIKLHEVSSKTGVNVKQELDNTFDTLFITSNKSNDSKEESNYDEFHMDEELLAPPKRNYCLTSCISFLRCDWLHLFD